jgi:hypothetical protein
MFDSRQRRAQSWHVAARSVFSRRANATAATTSASPEQLAAHKEVGVHRVAVGKTLLIAGVCALIPLIGNVAASFLTVWTGGGTWLVVPIVGVGVAMLTALIQAYGSAPATAPESGPHTGPQPPPDAYRPYGRVEKRGTPLALAIVIGLVVLGAGGWGLTVGVRYAVGYITGNETGPDRLVRPASGSEAGLTLTVENVWHTRHFTRIRMAARNSGGTSVSLPLFGNCLFRGQDGTTLQADPFRSRWSDSIPPGALQRGTITFKGHIPDSVRQASLSFAHIFGTFFGGAITVNDIRLRPA